MNYAMMERARKLEDEAVGIAEQKYQANIPNDTIQTEIAHGELKLKAAAVLRERAGLAPE